MDERGNEGNLDMRIEIMGVEFLVFADKHIFVKGAECDTIPHTHAFYEIKYFVGGKAEVVVADERLTVSHGDIILHAPSEYHYQTAEDVCEDTAQYSMRFMPTEPLAKESSARARAYRYILKILSSSRLAEDKEERLLPLFMAARDNIIKKGFGYRDAVRAIATAIIIETLRLLSPSTEYAIYTTGISDDISIKMDGFFSKYYSHPVGLSDFACYLSVSRRHASRLCRQKYGKSFVGKLSDMRAEQAKFLLRSTDRSVARIAADCGFSSASRFFKVFGAIAGETPTEYRKRKSDVPRI